MVVRGTPSTTPDSKLWGAFSQRFYSTRMDRRWSRCSRHSPAPQLRGRDSSRGPLSSLRPDPLYGPNGAIVAMLLASPACARQYRLMPVLAGGLHARAYGLARLHGPQLPSDQLISSPLWRHSTESPTTRFGSKPSKERRMKVYWSVAPGRRRLEITRLRGTDFR